MTQSSPCRLHFAGSAGGCFTLLELGVGMFDCACSTPRVVVVAAGALTVCQPEKGRSDADAPALAWVLLHLPEWQGLSDPRGWKAASTLRTASRDTLDSRRASQFFNSTWVSDLSRLRVGTKCCFNKIFFRDQVPNRACSFDFFSTPTLPNEPVLLLHADTASCHRTARFEAAGS